MCTSRKTSEAARRRGHFNRDGPSLSRDQERERTVGRRPGRVVRLDRHVATSLGVAEVSEGHRDGDESNDPCAAATLLKRAGGLAGGDPTRREPDAGGPRRNAGRSQDYCSAQAATRRSRAPSRSDRCRCKGVCRQRGWPHHRECIGSTSTRAPHCGPRQRTRRSSRSIDVRPGPRACLRAGSFFR